MWEVPVGFVRTRDDRIDKIADRQVQHAVAGVFQQLRDLGSARQTLRWYRDAPLPLPEVCPGTLGRDIRWRLPSAHRIHQMLRHPYYAGVLVYGRTAAKTVIVDGRARQSHRQTKPVAPWRIRLLDNHAGDLGWEDLLHTQQLLAANCTRPQDGAGGAAKRGPAFRRGVLRCGRCGRKRTGAYSGTTGRVPRYGCRGGRVERGSSSCLTLGGLCVDRAVAAAVLEARQPAGIHAALEALEQGVAQQDIQRQAWALALEQARDAAPRASRQYARAAPENHWVAGALEDRWDAARQRVQDAEAHLAALEQGHVPLREEQRQQLLTLGQELSAVWQQAAAPEVLKKRILRPVLHELMMRLSS